MYLNKCIKQLLTDLKARIDINTIITDFNTPISITNRIFREQIANIHWIIEKARELQKNIYLCFIDYAKDFRLCGSQHTVENS